MYNGVKSGDLGGSGIRTSFSNPTSRKILIQKCGNVSVEVRRGYSKCPHSNSSVRMCIKIFAVTLYIFEHINSIKLLGTKTGQVIT
jgi:hypothetical protein